MKPLLLSSEKIEKGSYNIVIDYFDNDDLIIIVRDFDTKEVIGYLDITDEDDINYNLN